MQETNEVRDRLVNEFAANYMEKLFYFCLKKTSSNAEAEDLTPWIHLILRPLHLHGPSK